MVHVEKYIEQMGYNSRYIQQLKLKGLKVLAEMKGFN